MMVFLSEKNSEISKTVLCVFCRTLNIDRVAVLVLNL